MRPDSRYVASRVMINGADGDGMFSRVAKYGLFASAGLLILVLGGVVTMALSPASGAYGADYLRKIFGDQPVAVMETAIFQVQDMVNKTEFSLGVAKAHNPFGSAAATRVAQYPDTQTAQALTPVATGTPVQTAASISAQGNPTKNSLLVPAGNSQAAVSGSMAANTWMPPAVDSSGTIAGSGVWQPYITNAAGRVVAYRTFVLPDPTRQYAYAAIVAFDLQDIRLHYVIGFSEPYAPGVKKTGRGVIPSADEQAGILLAAFNGGFKYQHGHFGSMANGLVSAPPVNGLGTLAIYQDGHIQIGAWNKDILPSNDLLAYRQNGPLVIQDGTVGSQVSDALIWGRTISGGIVTWRSGLALSADNRTLYYIVGPSLSVNTLAAAMLMVHPQAGIQLDINNYWVHFTAIRDTGGVLSAEALFPDAMRGNLDRFLKPYPRDFFYITAAQH